MPFQFIARRSIAYRYTQKDLEMYRLQQRQGQYLSMFGLLIPHNVKCANADWYPA